jgi:hypothetical protein
MGVIDCVPVDHSLRAAATTYELQPTIAAMGRYLSTRAHVRERDMAVNIRPFNGMSCLTSIPAPVVDPLLCVM